MKTWCWIKGTYSRSARVFLSCVESWNVTHSIALTVCLRLKTIKLTCSDMFCVVRMRRAAWNNTGWGTKSWKIIENSPNCEFYNYQPNDMNKITTHDCRGIKIQLTPYIAFILYLICHMPPKSAAILNDEVLRHVIPLFPENLFKMVNTWIPGSDGALLQFDTHGIVQGIQVFGRRPKVAG